MPEPKSDKQSRVIRVWAEDPSLSRKEVAEKCEVTPSYVSWIKHTFILCEERRKRVPDPSRKKMMAVERVEIKCLGPGKPHKFMSTDPRYNRLCDKCRKYAEAFGEYSESTRYRFRR